MLLPGAQGNESIDPTGLVHTSLTVLDPLKKTRMTTGALLTYSQIYITQGSCTEIVGGAEEAWWSRGSASKTETQHPRISHQSSSESAVVGSTCLSAEHLSDQIMPMLSRIERKGKQADTKPRCFLYTEPAEDLDYKPENKQKQNKTKKLGRYGYLPICFG